MGFAHTNLPIPARWFRTGMRPDGNEGNPMIDRRSLVLQAVAMSLCAPAIVRFGNLMPVKNRIHVRSPAEIGLIDRRHIASTMPQITALRRAGLPLHEIADALDRGSDAGPFKLIAPWSTQQVLRMIQEAELLRARDFAMGVSTNEHRKR
jgi:hypothetical protein